MRKVRPVARTGCRATIILHAFLTGLRCISSRRASVIPTDDMSSSSNTGIESQRDRLRNRPLLFGCEGWDSVLGRALLRPSVTFEMEFDVARAAVAEVPGDRCRLTRRRRRLQKSRIEGKAAVRKMLRPMMAGRRCRVGDAFRK
jgi:hypothetical protein